MTIISHYSKRCHFVIIPLILQIDSLFIQIFTFKKETVSSLQMGIEGVEPPQSLHGLLTFTNSLLLHEQIPKISVASHHAFYNIYYCHHRTS